MDKGDMNRSKRKGLERDWREESGKSTRKPGFKKAFTWLSFVMRVPNGIMSPAGA